MDCRSTRGWGRKGEKRRCLQLRIQRPYIHRWVPDTSDGAPLQRQGPEQGRGRKGKRKVVCLGTFQVTRPFPTALQLHCNSILSCRLGGWNKTNMGESGPALRLEDHSHLPSAHTTYRDGWAKRWPLTTASFKLERDQLIIPGPGCNSENIPACLPHTHHHGGQAKSWTLTV